MMMEYEQLSSSNNSINSTDNKDTNNNNNYNNNNNHNNINNNNNNNNHNNEDNNNNIRINNNDENNQKIIWKIGTQNTRDLRDIVKQNSWWNYCIEENFDVVLLTETKTTKETEKFIFFEQNQTSNPQDPLYNIWWSSTTEAY